MCVCGERKRNVDAVIYCELLQEWESKSQIHLNYNNKHSISVEHLSINRKQSQIWIPLMEKSPTHGWTRLKTSICFLFFAAACSLFWQLGCNVIFTLVIFYSVKFKVGKAREWLDARPQWRLCKRGTVCSNVLVHVGVTPSVHVCVVFLSIRGRKHTIPAACLFSLAIFSWWSCQGPHNHPPTRSGQQWPSV